MSQPNILVENSPLFFQLNDIPKVTKQETLKNQNNKLRLNKKTTLNLFVEINGFENKNQIGKTYTITNKNSFETNYYNNLFQKIKGNNTVLIKLVLTNADFYWTKSSFTINSNNTISFKILNYLSFKSEKAINKLMNTLELLENKNNTAVATKYLNGFLEEHSFNCFNKYLNDLK